MATVGYPCACQKEEGREQLVEIPLSGSRGWLHEKCHKPLYSLKLLGLYCALPVIVLTTLFKDGEQKVGLSVAVHFEWTSGETGSLGNVRVCGDRSWGGKAWEKQYLRNLPQDIWIGRHS